MAGNTTQEKKKNVLFGEVLSSNMHKSCVVRTTRSYEHPLYKKVVREFNQYKVHDESEQAQPGDTVQIYEGKPKSKHKYMYLDHIVRKAS